jgi:hypothetical protein
MVHPKIPKDKSKKMSKIIEYQFSTQKLFDKV